MHGTHAPLPHMLTCHACPLPCMTPLPCMSPCNTCPPMVSEWMVCILLECILVSCVFLSSLSGCLILIVSDIWQIQPNFPKLCNLICLIALIWKWLLVVYNWNLFYYNWSNVCSLFKINRLPAETKPFIILFKLAQSVKLPSALIQRKLVCINSYRTCLYVTCWPLWKWHQWPFCCCDLGGECIFLLYHNHKI